MKLNHQLHLCLCILVSIFSLSANAEDVIYPAIEEPNHRALFSNEDIHTYEVRLKPGEETFFHTHDQDHMVIIINDTLTVNEELGKTPQEMPSIRGFVAYFPYSLTGEHTHRIKVTGDREFHVIGFEFLKPAKAGSTFVAATPNKDILEFSQGVVKRIRIEPAEKVELVGDLLIMAEPGSLLESGNDMEWSFSAGTVQPLGDKRRGEYVNNLSRSISLYVVELREEEQG